MNVMNEKYLNRKSVADHLSLRSCYPINRFGSSKNNLLQLESLQSFYEGEELLVETNYSNEGTFMKKTSSTSNIFQENRQSVPSKVLRVREKTENENGDVYKTKEGDRSYIINNVDYKQPLHIVERKSFGTQYDKYDNTGKISINSYTRLKYHDTPTNIAITRSQIVDHLKLPYSVENQKRYAEKTTYCRPVIDYYSQAFVYKTMQKNERLKNLVQKLAIARKTERQTETWNNFINYLKNKHGYKSDKIQSTEEHYGSELIGDDCNIQYKLLQDFYDRNTAKSKFAYWPLNYEYESNYYGSLPPEYLRSDYSSKTHSYPYPISSQARPIIVNREREQKRLEKAYMSNNYYRHRPFSNTLIVDTKNKSRTKNYKKPQLHINNRNLDVKNKLNMNILHSSAVQTIPGLKESITCEVGNHCDEINNKKETVQEKYNKVSENVERLKKRNQEFNSESSNLTLASIETKLDTLIKSINSFIVQIQQKKLPDQNKNSVLVSCKSCSFAERTNKTNSEIFEIVTNKPIIRETLSNSSRSSISPTDKDTGRHYKHISGPEIDEIIIEEIDQSEKVKKDIESILKGNAKYPCNVQITVDIPTKERSTEVTASLSKAKITEMCPPEDLILKTEKEIIKERRMTIAVNTDPLGLLALFRVSTETVKQLLSYVPNIPYHTYLPMISLPRQRNNASQFVCNICGAAFARPSLLSDHINVHNLDHVRDCCICRHIIDAEIRKRRGLFQCRYCGQQFTRAYCWELHQLSCARTAGRHHDVPSTHMILQ